VKDIRQIERNLKCDTLSESADREGGVLGWECSCQCFRVKLSLATSLRQ
jgi:hypothetical protein